jgi:hypothetical protein
MSGPRLSFAYLREGTSDEGLLPHLRTLIVRAGASEAVGTARSYAGPTAVKMKELLKEEVAVDLVFVHRDADARSGDHRHVEISEAAAAVRMATPVVGVVPVQTIEAWLLIDEKELRYVAGKPSGRTPLNLPEIRLIENHHNPKAVLKNALLEASETSGRRRAKEVRLFSERRQTLLSRLDIDGPIRKLPAWRRLEKDVENAVSQFL